MYHNQRLEKWLGLTYTSETEKVMLVKDDIDTELTEDLLDKSIEKQTKAFTCKSIYKPV